jgi:hypothetical protein
LALKRQKTGFFCVKIALKITSFWLFTNGKILVIDSKIQVNTTGLRPDQRYLYDNHI